MAEPDSFRVPRQTRVCQCVRDGGGGRAQPDAAPGREHRRGSPGARRPARRRPRRYRGRRARPARARRVVPPRGASRHGRVAAEHRRGGRCRPDRRHPPRAAGAVRRGHLARGTRGGARRWDQRRYAGDERDRQAVDRGSRRDRASGRDPPRAGRATASRGSFLRRRSRRRRDDRRDGRDRGVGDDDRALRGDARERARVDDRGRPRRGGAHTFASAQVLGGLRPDTADDRLRGHARVDLRGHAAAPPDPAGDRGGGVHVPDRPRRRAVRYADRAVRDSRGPDRTRRRVADRGDQPP